MFDLAQFAALVWGGYPESAFKGDGFYFDDSSEDESIEETEKSADTLGPQIYHIPTLLNSIVSGRSKPQPASSSNKALTPREPASSLRNNATQSAASSSNKALAPIGQASSIGKNVAQGGFIVSRQVHQPKSLDDLEKQRSLEVQPQKKKPDPQLQIKDILSQKEALERQVEEYEGTSKADKQYRYLDEMLTRLMLKLDDVNTDFQPSLRQERKLAVKCVQDCIHFLEDRLKLNEEKLKNNSEVD